MKCKIYHYHAVHSELGEIACLQGACSPDTTDERAQEVMEEALKQAYNRSDSPSDFRREYEQGRIKMVLQSVETDEPQPDRELELFSKLLDFLANDQKPLDLTALRRHASLN